MPKKNGLFRKRISRRRRIARGKRFNRKVVRAVARASEKKLVTASLGIFSAPFRLTNAPYLYVNPIENVVQGTTRGTRVGNRIYLRRSKLRFLVAMNWISGDQVTTVNHGYRIIVGYFKNQQYINSDIFETVAGSTNQDRWLAPIDIDKFYVMKDKVYTLDNYFALMGQDYTNRRVHKMSIRWNKPILFNDNLATAASQSVLPAVLFLSNTYQGAGTIAANPNDFLMYGMMLSSFTDL